MSEPLVISVVTPSYNQGEFLEETLVSVLSQEGDFFLDYLVIDGGSTDESLEIIRRFAEQIENGKWPVHCQGLRFRWVSERDRGQADAVMKGFRLAEGEIWAWLNSDDVYLPGTLRVVSSFFREHSETGLLYGGAYYCDSSGVIDGRYPTSEFDLMKLAWFNFFCQPSTFFRKHVFDAVGGLDCSLHYAMDYDLFIRIAKRYCCRYIPEVLSKYRLHEKAKTVRNDTLSDNHDETLNIALKHYHWAPLNLVYGSCYYRCLSHWPGWLPAFKPLILGTALVYTLCRSVRLNHGIRRADLRLLNWNNCRKLLKDRSEILRGA